jgi:hypothetical protein
MFLRTLCAVLLLASCHSASRNVALEIDARTVVASRLTHGLGDDVLDSPLANDSTNATLLVALRHGMDSTTLAGRLGTIPDGWARINGLRTAGLVARDSAGFHTTFPIVIGPDRTWYDSVTRAVGAHALRLHEPRFRAILAEVERRGWHAWQYHFIWSQIFDSQHLWAEVSDAGVTPPLAPAITWVIYPQHPFKSGTNYYPGRIDPPAYLAVTWTPAVRSHLRAVELAAEAFVSLVVARRITDSARTALRTAGLLSDSRKPAVPVILANDPLLADLHAISDAYFTTLRKEIDSDFLARRLHCSPGVAWAMAYHDIGWSILQTLVDRGLVAPFGVLLSGPAGTVPVGTTALVPTDSSFTRVLRAVAGTAK